MRIRDLFLFLAPSSSLEGACVLCISVARGVYSDILGVDILSVSIKNRRFESILVAFHLLGPFSISFHLGRCK